MEDGRLVQSPPGPASRWCALLRAAVVTLVQVVPGIGAGVVRRLVRGAAASGASKVAGIGAVASVLPGSEVADIAYGEICFEAGEALRVCNMVLDH